MGEKTNRGSRKSLWKSGRSIKAASNELQNLDRVEARSEVIGHDAVSRIEYSSDESAVKYRGTQGDWFRFGHDHLRANAQGTASRALIGNLRIRLPVAAKTAFATAGPTVAVGTSPTPPGGSLLRITCVSTMGASFIRIGR